MLSWLAFLSKPSPRTVRSAAPSEPEPTTSGASGRPEERNPATTPSAVSIINNTPIQVPGGSRRRPPPTPAQKKLYGEKLRFQLVLSAAKTVVKVLHGKQIPCAIFGGLACRIYGNPRCPKDVDVLVLHSPQANSLFDRQIKEIIVETDPYHFYLKVPRDPNATYRILMFRQKPDGYECKVDIVIPGIMYLPNLSPTLLTWMDRLPLIPYELLLLHKLQAWDDHRKAVDQWKKDKQYVDAEDVKQLMRLSYGLRLRTHKPWNNPEIFIEEFCVLTLERVKDFCVAYPECREGWKLLGFEVD
ncbi:hypothetical protein BDN72DRAFT_905536 [Pluteus cervinus]|uniref:Uncharacterized protein n=1 Tax=Pluteus cervinus TaxID=181527 RepID=A0ACD3A252_9AGAR|nr:hypothetical protein BDN72DRAFT_905536 [Pluteus cervinus]